MNNSRSNNILFVGVAVFAIGAALAFFGLKSQDRAVAKPESQPFAVATPGTAVRTVQTGTAGAAAAQYSLPKGMQAVSIEVPAVPGLAGYVQPNDTINIYATVRNGQPNSRLKTPFAKLVMTGVKVLDVRAGAAGGGGNTTYLLALNVDQAEQIIFYAKYESLWIALTTADQKPVTSSGRSYQNAL